MGVAENLREVVILGTGPAGLTAGIYTARANLNPLIIHGPQPGGQLTTTTHVENFPGFSEGILGPDLMEEMRKQAERFGAEMLQALATKVDLSSRPFRIWVDDEVISTKALIIATGASAKLLGLEREAEMMGFGLSTCATCDGAFFNDREIVVIGGGDSACEEAIFLTKFGTRVRLVHRRDELRASKIMAQRALEHPKIEVLWNSIPVRLVGDRKSGITGLTLRNTLSGAESDVACDAIFYGIGHTPNTTLFEGQLKMDENKYLLTKPDSSQTDIAGVFACGDVQDHIFRQAVTAAGSGCMAAIEAERFLAEHSS
jgi:thioredoxin reductase (NADPH)